MIVSLTAIILIAGFVVCDDDTTDLPSDDVHGKTVHLPVTTHYGAARQMQGSVRPVEGKITKTKARKQKAQYERPMSNNDRMKQRPPLPHGVIMLAPKVHTPPPIMAQDINGINLRFMGGGVKSNTYGIPPSTGVMRHTDIYGIRNPSERHGDLDSFNPMDRYNHPSGRLGEFPTFISDDELENPGDGSDLNAVENCDMKCEKREFKCDKSCSCIHVDLRCDGQADCILGEDEQDCENVHQEMFKQIKNSCEASGTHVLCPATYTCISKSWQCDGANDCGDNTDEAHCNSDFKLNCPLDKFECSNGLCIPRNWVCDGDNDCNDLSDELNCTRECTKDEFRCLDGSCISSSFRCDGETDCIDGTDENMCDTPMPNCPEGEFKCKGSLGGMGGPGGRCVLMRFRCDGDNDCGDWSDEENCPKKQVMCTNNEFRCADGDCIPLAWKCDEKQDCDGGEDEKGCSTVEKNTQSCSPDEFTCRDGRCILNTWVCDGIADCKRGEDELNCSIKCEINQFTCESNKLNGSKESICINQKHVCDGHNDCLEGEDEYHCPIAHPCGAHSLCQQKCVTAYGGREECRCDLGYLMHSNGYNCTDIDECQFAINPVCSQICINTPGSYKCACVTGYTLRPDMRSCKALGGPVKLLMANRADIRSVSLSNNQYTSVVKGLPNAIALDYHYKKDMLFWTDVSIDVIKRSFLNGTVIKDVVKWGLESPGGLAVDWIHDLLFWTDSGTRRVEVSTFDGLLRTVIAANDLDKPRAISVHPGKAMVFWTDWGNNAKIERAYMDGSDRRAIISEAIFWPNGLTIDYTAERIYWADAKHVIESATFDGIKRKKVMSSNLPHPFSLTLFEDSMYWTDWHTKTVATASKLNGKNFRLVHEGLHFPMGIQSYHPSRQPDYESRCPVDARGLKGGCSHLCLPNKFGRRCVCPTGLTLKKDGRTCSNVLDKLLLIARKKDIRVRQLDTDDPSKGVDMVVPLEGIKSTVAIEWCSENNYIYWTDVGKSVISRSYINGSKQEVIISSNLMQPAGLALDWVTNKIYWTDPGTNRIEAATTNGKQRALLIWQRLDKPRDIVVNPRDGWMFWTDWGAVPMIERAGMDGSSRMTLVSENLQWPNGLALDITLQRLFFLDGGTKALEFINFDGTGRGRLIKDGLPHPFGIDVYGTRVYWTDWDTQSIQSADKFTGDQRVTILSNTSDLMDLRIFHRERIAMRNPCAINNGNCSYICLLYPNGRTCACPIGIQLNDDGMTCKTGPSNYLLFAHRTDIRQVSLDSDYQIDVVLPLPPISNAVALDVDTKTGEIYWADTVEDVIMKSNPDGTKTKQILSESMDSVDGLIIDSIGRKIYWTDAGRHSIEVSELDGSIRSVIVWQDLESPRGIAIHYELGYLFWADWGSNPRIERADMDGENRKIIVSQQLGWPNGLAIDVYARRIFWTDAQVKRIETCDLEGGHRRIIIAELQHPYGLAVTAKSIYWTDWVTKALHAISKDSNSNKQRIVANDLEGLMDVKAILRQEDDMDNPCGRNNGGCSHLCLRKPGSPGYACKCPTGIRMREGSTKQCEDLPQKFLLIALRSGIGRISLDTPEMFDVVLPIDGVHGAVVVDYHYNKSLLFYADVNIDAIRRINMKDYSDSKIIVSTGLNTPNGIAVDWLANNIYWTDTAMKKIEVSRLDGTSRKVILTDNLDDPRAIILYPKRGFIFWADWGQSPKIERAYMDGSNRKVIVDSELGFPTGLAIDFEARRIYWADALQDRIEMCDFSGRKRSQVIPHATHPFGFTVTPTHLYWTDWYNKSVLRAPKKINPVVEEVRFGLRGALEVRSVSSDRQPRYNNPCAEDNGGCTHLCLFIETDYVCVCPDVSDGRPCKTSPSFSVPVIWNDEKLMEKNEEKTVTAAPGAVSKNSNEHAQFVIIATAISGGILIVVVIAILVLVFNSKRKNNKKTSRSGSDVLTFTNPNYNCNSVEPGPSRNTIWKRLKYDKAQERVYEEKYLGPGHQTTAYISPASSSQISSTSALPL